MRDVCNILIFAQFYVFFNLTCLKRQCFSKIFIFKNIVKWGRIFFFKNTNPRNLSMFGDWMLLSVFCFGRSDGSSYNLFLLDEIVELHFNIELLSALIVLFEFSRKRLYHFYGGPATLRFFDRRLIQRYIVQYAGVCLADLGSVFQFVCVHVYRRTAW